jgi:hypothetical protein
MPQMHKYFNVSGIFTKKCNCNKFGDILDYDLLKKRFKETKNILTNLTLIAEHPGKEHYLYECQNCAQLWQRSLSWMDGNKQYVYQVPQIEKEVWKCMPFVQPDDLFVRTGVINQYLERGTFQEQNFQCRRSDCSHHAIKLSVFCIVHQMQNIGIEATLPNDVTWFLPYEKELVELTYERLSELPNYKKYHQ